MTTVADVLAEHDLDVPDGLLAAELRALLDRNEQSRAASSALTAEEETLLEEHGGVGRASARQLAALAARTAALGIHTAADALSRQQAAQLLGVETSRVSHRTRDRQLYCYRGASGRPRYPSWQFDGDHALPHLDRVVAALPDGAHPAIVAAFMTAPLDSLRLHRRVVSPWQWLREGGDAAPVVAAAVTLGEQV